MAPLSCFSVSVEIVVLGCVFRFKSLTVTFNTFAPLYFMQYFKYNFQKKVVSHYIQIFLYIFMYDHYNKDDDIETRFKYYSRITSGGYLISVEQILSQYLE